MLPLGVQREGATQRPREKTGMISTPDPFQSIRKEEQEENRPERGHDVFDEEEDTTPLSICKGHTSTTDSKTRRLPWVGKLAARFYHFSMRNHKKGGEGYEKRRPTRKGRPPWVPKEKEKSFSILEYKGATPKLKERPRW